MADNLQAQAQVRPSSSLIFFLSSCDLGFQVSMAAIIFGPAALIPAAPMRLLPAKNPASLRWLRVSNGSKTRCMQTWSPLNNKKFETLSYLPPLSVESIAKEIDYMIANGWAPCLEFDEVGHVYRSNSRIPGYYDGRYWTMWKLPMFGCTDASQVLEEIRECREAYPGAFIRLLGFDNKRQCQCISFVIQKPTKH